MKRVFAFLLARLDYWLVSTCDRIEYDKPRWREFKHQ